jgi:glyoxylase-like metal-dependent hydrolase (beta-lactamase superfamily II)
MALPEFEVYALRYATLARQARENFIVTDVHDAAMPMDYFVWAILGEGGPVVVDTGFAAAAAERRGRTLLRCPTQALARLGVDANQVTQVAITHLHYDHAGNLDKFPRATFHLQEAEMAFATGRCMCEPFLRHAYDVDDVVQMVRHVYDGRVRFHRGDVELRPGISLHRIGGHTDGLQAVRVFTRRGWVVLASDATHYMDNLRRRSPFPIVYHLGDMLHGYDVLRKLAASDDHVIPGHDPMVLAAYPALAADAPDIVALHLEPHSSRS